MTARIVVILLIAEACFAANLVAKPKTLEFHLPKDHPLARRFKDIADPNGYIDTILVDLDESLESHGYAGLPLPPGQLGIDDEIAGVPVHMSLSVDNGTVNHLDSIQRDGEATVSQTADGQTVITTSAVVNNLTADYRLRIEFEGTVLQDSIILVDAVRVPLHLELFANETTGQTAVRSFYTVEVEDVVIELGGSEAIQEIVVPRLQDLFKILVRVGTDYLIADPIIALLEDVLAQNPLPSA